MMKLASLTRWSVGLCSMVFAQMSTAEVEWKVEGGGSLRMDRGNLVVEYASPDHSPITLIPKEPILLPDDVNRIVFWFAAPRGDCSFEMMIRDGSGQIHDLAAIDSALEGARINWDPARKREWPMWAKAESMQLKPPSEDEMRRRLRPADAEAALARIWPRPLSLAGIRIRPSQADDVWGGAFLPATKADINSGKGVVWIKPPEWETVRANEADFYAILAERYRSYRDRDVAFFPDDLTTLKGGPIRYAIKIYDGYNGPVIWSGKGKVTLDRDDPESLFSQQIPIPQLPIGKYLVDTKAWRLNGELLNHYRFRILVGESGVDGLEAVESEFELTTGHPMHVFPSGTREAELQLTTSDEILEKTEGASVKIRVIDFFGEVVFEKAFPPAQKIAFEVPVQPDTDYFAQAILADGNQTKDIADLHFGIASSALEKPSGVIPESVPDLHGFLDGHAHINVEYREPAPISYSYPHISQMDFADLKLFGEQVKELGFKTISIKASWPYVEPLPGVFRFGLIDRQVQTIAEVGDLGIFIGYAPYATGIWAPNWLPVLPFRSQDGEFTEKNDVINPLADVAMDHWVEYWKRLASRFYDNPTIYGYRTYNTSLYGGPNPSRPEAYVSDYSDAAQDAFDDWLKAQNREPYPLSPLLTIPGVDVAELGPDLSSEWKDFIDFSSHVAAETTRRSLEAIRSVDPKRMIEVDRKSHPYAVEQTIPIIAQYGAAMKNEGSPGFREAALRSMAIQAGVPFTEELHRHIVTSRSIADATNYFATFLGNGTMWLTRWLPEHLQKDYSHGFIKYLEPNLEFLKETQPRWNAYLVGQFYEPKVLIVGSRAAELQGGRRRGFFFDMAGLDTYSALFEWQQVPAHYANEYSTWVDYSKFKLLFADGEILPQATVDRLIAYARDGGKLVLVGNVGDLVPENPTAGNILRAEIGDLPNVRSIPSAAPIRRANSAAWDVPKSWDDALIDEILAWAGVHRPVQVTSENPLGFQVQFRKAGDHTVTLAVMRNFYGWYRNNIEFEEPLKKKFGSADGEAAIFDLTDGDWKVDKLHREPREVGVFTASGGTITFPVDEAVAGEVQLFRVTRVRDSESASLPIPEDPASAAVR